MSHNSQFKLLAMCTANQCRSAMSEVIADAQLKGLGVDAVVRSCGVMEGGVPAAYEAARAVRSRHLDLSRHVSARIDVDTLLAADLVLTMQRSHLSEIAKLDLDSLAKSFTLVELAELAPSVGIRRPSTTTAQWIAQASRFRDPGTVLSFDTASDVPDPIGRPQRAFNRCADEIERLLESIWCYLFPST